MKLKDIDIGCATYLRTDSHGAYSPTYPFQSMWYSGAPVEPVLFPAVGAYPTYAYDDNAYDWMSGDEPRNTRYNDAIAQLAAGRTVVDIGTGRDVNWAKACVQAGAVHAYAVEALQTTYLQAKENVQRWGLTEQITVLHGMSTALTLPEKVDMCVSEIIGAIGSCEGAPAIQIDARNRLLGPRPIMVPQRCATRIAAATLPEDVHKQPRLSTKWVGWFKDHLKELGHPHDVRVCVTNLGQEHLLSAGELFEDIRFDGTISTASQLSTELTITRSGRLDGFALWVNLWCVKDGSILDALTERSNWFPAFFPVFYPGIAVRSGDRLRFVCVTQLSDDGIRPDYELRGVLIRDGGRIETPFSFKSTHHGTEFRSNPFYRMLFSPVVRDYS